MVLKGECQHPVHQFNLVSYVVKGCLGSLDNINLLSAPIFGNLILLECCFIPIPAQPFPWEVRSRILGLIRENLQMFVNTLVVTQTKEDLPFKHVLMLTVY